MIKSVIKQLCPPLLQAMIRRYLGRYIRWQGNYTTWQAAQADTKGYDQQAIFERVKQATFNVVSGKALAERDGVNFDQPLYHWPLIAVLQLAYLKQGKAIEVTDFGGSLGSHYWSIHKLLPVKVLRRWQVVEQAHFVTYGQQHLTDQCLCFAREPDNKANDFLLCSGVLQYLDNPYALLEQYLKRGYQWVVLDRVIFSVNDQDRITKQIVPASIYRASYPCWHLSESKLRSLMEQYGYEVLSEISDVDGDGSDYYFKGFIYQKAVH